MSLSALPRGSGVTKAEWLEDELHPFTEEERLDRAFIDKYGRKLWWDWVGEGRPTNFCIVYRTDGGESQ